MEMEIFLKGAVDAPNSRPEKIKFKVKGILLIRSQTAAKVIVSTGSTTYQILESSPSLGQNERCR